MIRYHRSKEIRKDFLLNSKLHSPHSTLVKIAFRNFAHIMTFHTDHLDSLREINYTYKAVNLALFAMR